MTPEQLIEVGLEGTLVQAITNGQAWFASEETVESLNDITGPQMRQELDGILQEIRRGEYGLNLNWWPQGTLTYSLGRYSGNGITELKQKLAQFPMGTHLELFTSPAERERHRAEFAEVEDAVSACGLVLHIHNP
jgi:hypothetical protein